MPKPSSRRDSTLCFSGERWPVIVNGRLPERSVGFTGHGPEPVRGADQCLELLDQACDVEAVSSGVMHLDGQG